MKHRILTPGRGIREMNRKGVLGSRANKKWEHLDSLLLFEELWLAGYMFWKVEQQSNRMKCVFPMPNEKRGESNCGLFTGRRAAAIQ
jgi:hypothetical protein